MSLAERGEMGAVQNFGSIHLTSTSPNRESIGFICGQGRQRNDTEPFTDPKDGVYWLSAQTFEGLPVFAANLLKRSE